MGEVNYDQFEVTYLNHHGVRLRRPVFQRQVDLDFYEFIKELMKYGDVKIIKGRNREYFMVKRDEVSKL